VNTTFLLQEAIAQNQTNFAFIKPKLTINTLGLRLNAGAASVGFIVRHLGEISNLLGYFLGRPAAVPNTTMGQTDTGQPYDLPESLALIEQGFAMLEELVATATPDFWEQKIETPFFGEVSRARLFFHILYHNSYHYGQLGLTLAKGTHFGAPVQEP
jgi:hypothetical protein